jgi:hypothetical protein
MSIEVVSMSEDGVRTLSDEKETKIEKTEVVTEESETTEEIEQTEETEELAAAGEEESEEVQEEVKPKKKGGFQKKLERKDREIEELRQQLAAKSTQTEQKESVSFDKKKPVIDDFNSHAEFTEALAEWVADKRDAEKAVKAKKAETFSEVQGAVRKYQEALKELKKTTPDLDDVFDEVSHITPCPALQEAIITSDISAQVAYELAKNPEEFERINKLSPVGVLKEIGKLELKISKAAEDKKAAIEAEKTKTTKAPAPLRSLSGKATVTPKSLEEMSTKEYMKYMDEKEFKQRKRA